LSEAACFPSYDNPFSQPPVDASGNHYDPKTQNKNKALQKFWKYWPVGFYVQKVTKTSPNKMICSRGNEALYTWCNYPKTRGMGKGIDDVPAFPYHIKGGVETCSITKDYCDSRGISYDSSKEDC
jgi:hypothetical protein